MPSDLESQAGVGRHDIALEFLYQGIPERPCLSCGRGCRAPPSTSRGHGGLEENKAARTFPILEEGSGHGKPLSTLYLFPFPFFFFFFFWFLTYSFVVYVQAIQEVFMAEKWVNDARNEARVKANLRTEANRALGASK